MSADESFNGNGSRPYEIIVVKHIPSRSQYVPADRIIARHAWGPGDGLDYQSVYKDLDEFTAQAILEWTNPATQADSTGKVQPTSPTSTSTPPEVSSTKPSGSGTSNVRLQELARVSYTDYKTGNGAWTYSNQIPEDVLELLRKGPIDYSGYTYKLSGPLDAPTKFVARYRIKASA